MGSVPLVSIVLLCYNQDKYIEKCLASIDAQTYKNFEIIAVDDCSTDQTSQLLATRLSSMAYPFSLIENEENLGVSKSADLGARSARGSYIIMFAGDDEMLPHRLESQITFFEGCSPDVGVIYGDLITTDSSGQGDLLVISKDACLTSDFFHCLLNENIVAGPATMFKRWVAEQIGYYDTALAFEDYDFWLSAASRGVTFRHQREVVTRYRLHSESFSRSPRLQATRLVGMADIFFKWRGHSSSARAIVTDQLRGIVLSAVRLRSWRASLYVSFLFLAVKFLIRK